MKYKFAKTNRLAALLRRAALGGCLALSLSLGAHAQSPNDTALIPTPYSWPAFHAGGTSPGTVNTTGFTLGFNPNPNPLAGQLQGTPTSILTNAVTGTSQLDEVASYLLGNYDPNVPPAGPLTLNPNNFRDSAPFNILEWFSPFPFTLASGTNLTELTADDSAISTAGTGFADTGTWSGPLTDGTANNQEYIRVGASATSSATATWSFPSGATPTPLTAGYYVVTVHIPDTAGVAPAGSTTTAPTELRVTDAHYIVKDTTSVVTLADTRISQTEANANQFLAGPFFINAGDKITVTLDNSTAGTTAGRFVVADAVSLQSGYGAVVESQPTAINATEYPEIQNALYYGVASRSTAGANTSTPDPTPYGNKTLEAAPATDSSANAAHRIRSLVYYGRQENIVLQSTAGELVDATGKPVTKPVIQQVGAVYCVDGQNGEVVWRYQTPAILANAKTGSGALPSREVFSSPVLARINVSVPQYATGQTLANPPTLLTATKLVVIVGDNNGMVYCLDAVGARDGTSNGDAVSAFEQPIFNPQAPLNAAQKFNPTGLQDATPKAHVGNTFAYWVYRPDPAVLHTANGAGKVDATSNLPVPGSFGSAAPVVFVSPDKSLSPNAVGVTSGTETGVPALTSNATIYIGNGNGVLYALDAFGGKGANSGMYNDSRLIADMTAPDAAAGSGSIPTTEVNWWLPLNGSKTVENGSATTGNGYESIVSAPALLATSSTGTILGSTSAFTATRTIYVTSADDTDNEGRLYAVQTSGFGSAEVGPKDVKGGALTPGTAGYNDKAVSLWEFPNRYARTSSAYVGAKKIHVPLGSITGSPVVFTNPDGAFEGTTTPTTPATRVYFAACSGLEYGDTVRPTIEETGRIWAVDAATGATVWAFPDALDPNVTAQTQTIGGASVSSASPPPDPLGAFRYATPAIGLVQFPSFINSSPVLPYLHTDRNAANPATVRADIRGQVVPMLYVGSAGNGVGQQGPRLYGLDLDGANDTERQIFEDTTTKTATNGATPGVVSPAGNFETSPALVVNATNTTTTPSTGPGNGGVLFIASGTTLYQFSATPVTSRDPAATQPNYNPLPILNGIGALSSPSVSAYVDTDLITTSATATPIVRDWVYFGDAGQGLADGITPLFGGGGDGSTLQSILPNYPPNLTSFVLPQFPLYSYIFDGTSAHLGTDTNMKDANQIGQAEPLFEWGQNVYIRIGNVVPPNTGDPTKNTDTAALRITDPDDSSIFFTNGGPVTIQISDVDPGNNRPLQTDSGQVPAVILPIPPALPTDPPLAAVGGTIPNGFFKRTDKTQGTPPYYQHPNEQLGAPDNGWVAAYTYAIRDGSARRNTPGTTRRVVTATQIAQAFRLVDDGTGVYVPQFIQSVTLQTTITQGSEYTKAVNANGKPTSIDAIAVVDQPTFGILNPLAVRGGGVPLFTGAAGANLIGSNVGPFYGIDTGNMQADDYAALGNGDRFPRTIPLNGVIGANGASTGRPRFGRAVVVTDVGDINHGSTGSNADTVPGNAPTGTRTGSAGSSTPSLSSTKFGPFAFDVADRSALGLAGQTLSHVVIDTAALRWTDNTGSGGPGAMVNPLPWEALPHAAGAGSNTSLDYPDISGKTVAMTLNAQTVNGTSGDITNQAATPDPATVSPSSNDLTNRIVTGDPVQVQVSVPLYQPADLQLFDTGPPGSNGANGQGPIDPTKILTTNDEYPMGYVSNQRVFVDSNHNGRYDEGEAYRTFRTFAGVPVDMATTIDTPTVDLGKLPQSFGVQTQTAALGLFDPLNTNYQSFFKPLTISNHGNTNLMNVHLDQKYQTGVSGTPTPLPLVGSTLDPSSAFQIPAFDANGITGPRTADVGGSIVEQAYLLRSSLDPDLVTAYGINPALSASNLNGQYPGLTFRKARVGSSGPTTLRIPDSPDDPTNAAYLTPSPNNLPTTTLDANGKPYTAPPYIGLAVPLGSPVGTYALNLQLYEGLDPGTFKPIVPPTYGGSTVSAVTATGPTSPGSPTPANLRDAITLVTNGATTTPLQPYSNPVTVKATVTEARITDGASRGDLPQVDSGLSGTVGGNPAATANFLPSAFRDPTSGNISLYWTSSRIAPYTLAGANLGYTTPQTGTPYFGAAGSTWWSPITGISKGTSVLPTPGYNTSISVTPPAGGSAYAFVQNVAGGGGATYKNNLYCYQVTPSTGALTGGGVLVTQNTSQATFGARGLTFTGTFTDAYPGATGTISDNLFAFWYGGSRGRSSIYYSSSVTASGGAPGAFGPVATLPIPAGLSAVSEPNAVLTQAPDSTGKAVPVIEVTYTGIAPDGNADIYVSRYQPYLVRKSGSTTATSQVALALLAAPIITEQLQGTDGNLYYQARDVAWARNGILNVVLDNQNLLLASGSAVQGYNAQPYKTNFDRATGQIVYTNVSSTGATAGGSNLTIYVDLARGRIRFSPQLTGTHAVYATFNPQARRITTDSRADTAPISFLDEAAKPNEADSGGAALGTVQANRYWFLWRKSGASGTSTTASLYYKTQRLTIDLQLKDGNGQPIGVKLKNTGSATAPVYAPDVIVTSAAGTTLFDPTATTNLADVDWVRGRVYLPLTDGSGNALEGALIKVSGTDANGKGFAVTDNAHWLDEPRYNEKSSPNAASGTPVVGKIALSATATGDAAIPIDTIVNESNVTAFLDPDPNQAHKVWLFWNSTRNGTADLYYETISPLFSALGGQ